MSTLAKKEMHKKGNFDQWKNNALTTLQSHQIKGGEGSSVIVQDVIIH